MGYVSAMFELTVVDLRKQDWLQQDRTDGDIREGAFNPKVTRSRLARPTNNWEVGRVGPAAIRTEGLTKRYGDVAALDSLDLDVAEGEVVGYLGPNGAGKTTTIRLLLGLIRPTAGRGEIFGLDCQHRSVEAHRRLAYVAGEASLWPSLTGLETLHLLGRVQGRVDEAYRDELIGRFDLDPSKKVRAYSKGNRQKVILIGALMTRSDLLVLDEPTSGLDPLMEQAFRHCIHEAKGRGQTVFLSSHIMSEVEALCDRVGILRDGMLVEMGTLADMRHLSALTVEATFDGTVPDLSSVPGVRSVHVEGRVARCQVRGTVAPLLKVLASSGVNEMLSREPSLEELFLALYGEGVQADGNATRGS
jgi:ABC-2 type transport system ATP-binding protein